MKEVSDFISTVGFPILVSLLMIYQQEKNFSILYRYCPKFKRVN